MKRHIPNLLTLCNLFCGLLGLVYITEGNVAAAGVCIAVAMVLDIADGLTARALNAYSPLGKELDSLADIVSFGVAPGWVVARMIAQTQTGHFFPLNPGAEGLPLFLAGFLIPVFSALRLARFNLDTRQQEGFIGVPTPANTGFLFALWFSVSWQPESLTAKLLENPWAWVLVSLLTSLLLVAEIPLISLKIKTLSWGPNRFRYLLLLTGVLLFAVWGWAVAPLIFALYLSFSWVDRKFASTFRKNP
ncbi:MAG: CDP-diacylglycerol O-phosphatidyltransferase [Bacteroidetes bacterium]|nr:MAG: CDP-diacylglycerol O-phosphatidyltransferase [Bacteroidota bacterium]